VRGKKKVLPDLDYDETNEELVNRLTVAETRYKHMPDEDRALCPLPAYSLLGQVDDMKDMIKDLGVDLGLAKAINKTFLSLVGGSYWRQMEQGKVRPGTEEADTLLSSVRLGQSTHHSDLCDLSVIFDTLLNQYPGQFKIFSKSMADDQGADPSRSYQVKDNIKRTSMESVDEASTPPTLSKRMHKFARSKRFGLGMAAIILMNALYVLLDEGLRSPSNEDHGAWVFFEVVFTLVFIVEFALKLWDQHVAYFFDGANIFDLVLVLLGTAGCTVMLASRGGDDFGAGEARTVRVTRIFRVLRFLRVFRLLNGSLWKASDAVSAEVLLYMKTITVFTCFIEAHFSSQLGLLRYFGGNGKIDNLDEAELARCILQSQVAVYKAITWIVSAKKRMDKDLLNEMEWANGMLKVTEGLEKFVMDAHENGAINDRATESILHPLHHRISECLKTLEVLDRGHIVKHNTHSGDVPTSGNSSDSMSHARSEARLNAIAESSKSQDVCFATLASESSEKSPRSSQTRECTSSFSVGLPSQVP
jgi:hypothetical protein